MSGQDDLTPDDGLAPVTDLFGARSSSRSRRVRSSEADRPRADRPPAAGSRDALTDPGAADAGAAWLPPVTGAATRDTDDEVAPVRPLRSGPGLGTGERAGADDGDGVGLRWAGGVQDLGDDAGPTREEFLAEAERISMRALGRRGMSVSELRTTLVARDLPDDVVEHELDRLARVGLLDDVRLAADLVDRLHDRKALGRQGVVAELRRRGIDQTAIDAALAEHDDDGAESARATELARKRAGQLRGLDHETAERRLTGFLMRKGYSGSVVRAAVRTALDGGGRRGGVRFE